MDGVAVCVQNYACHLQKQAGGVCVITPKNYGVQYNEDYKVLTYLSVPVPFRHPYVTGLTKIDFPFLKRLGRHRFKIVHAHSPFSSGFCAQQVAKTQNIPLVATFHSKFRDDFSRIIPSKFIVDKIISSLIRIYEKADEVWVPQESVKEVIREYGYKGQVEVVENGCDMCGDYGEAFFREARNRVGVSADELVLLFVGQHIWEKNTRLILEALEHLGNIPYRMFFVGTGYAAGEMAHIARQKGIADKVKFVGNVTDRAALKDYYAAADLFLFPSLYDTFGLVVREAAALHTPSIMMQGSTASCVIDDGVNGFLTGNDPEDMARIIRALASDREKIRRAGAAASRTIVRSWESIVDEVLNRYNDLIRRHKMIL
ncbi:MAG: glycosyltransferase [Bacteroidales bacterium]|nr:glycosyltransferase [Bacteroidales bacterium]